MCQENRKVKQMKNAVSLDMTEGNSMRHILLFALPLFIGTLFQQAYNLADTMIAGHSLGNDAVAAIGSTSALYSVIIYFAGGLNNGYGILISRLFGAKNKERLRQAVAVMIVLDLVVTVILTAVILPLLRPILHLLDTPQDILVHAYEYIFVIFAGMVMTICYNMCAGFLRALGNSRVPLYFLILSCCLNIGMDVMFMVVLKMGVMGAALATVIAEAVSAFACMWYIYRQYWEFLPGWKDWKLPKDLVGEMFSIGLSMAMMQSVFALGSIILQKAINNLGTGLITAHTASRRVYELLMMPMSTVGTANATFVSQNFGAGKMKRITDTLKKVMWIELVWSFFSLVVSVLLGREIVKLLLGTGNEDVLSNAVLNLNASTLFFFPLGVLLVMRMSMQSMGYKVAPVISSSIELVVKIVASQWLIPRWGYIGVVATEPVIWVLCMIFLLFIYSTTYKTRLGINEVKQGKST